MKPFLLLSILSFLSGCVGELHFVSGQKKKTPPEEPPKPIVKHEDFRYRTPSGAVDLLFVFYPLKTMDEVIDQFAAGIGDFQDQFWLEADHYDSVRWMTILDNADPSFNTFDPKAQGFPRDQWISASRDYFTRRARQLKDQLEAGPVSALPIDTFRKVNDFLATFGSAETIPSWRTFVYLRNRDLLIPEPLLERLEGSHEAFLTSLSPVSLFHFNIERIAYLTEKTACAPSSTKIASTLKTHLSRYPGQMHELCGFDRMAMRNMAQDLNESHRRMIFSHKPELETLSIAINSHPIPREWTRFEPKMNELLFTESVTVSPGDVVHVEYQVETPKR